MTSWLRLKMGLERNPFIDLCSFCYQKLYHFLMPIFKSGMQGGPPIIRKYSLNYLIENIQEICGPNLLPTYFSGCVFRYTGGPISVALGGYFLLLKLRMRCPIHPFYFGGS